jgi:hypothetical protein
MLLTSLQVVPWIHPQQSPVRRQKSQLNSLQLRPLRESCGSTTTSPSKARHTVSHCVTLCHTVSGCRRHTSWPHTSPDSPALHCTGSLQW